MRHLSIRARRDTEVTDFLERDHSVLLSGELFPAVHVTASDTNGGVEVMRKFMMLLLGILAYRRLAKQNHKADHSTAMG